MTTPTQFTTRRLRAGVPATYLVAMVLQKFYFLLGKGCHGNGLDPVGRVEPPPGRDKRDKTAWIELID